MSIFSEVRVLRTEGKLHKALIIRTQILFGISLILLGVVAYELTSTHANIVVVGALAAVGLLLGLFLFSRMTVVNWNEEKELVETGRMDRVGYTVLGLYIVFEIGFRTVLHDFYPASATAFLLAGVFGILLGRAVGTVIEIHRVYLASHTKR